MEVGNKMSELKTAKRWMFPEHECPYCEHVQQDAVGLCGEKWNCEECGKEYILEVIE